MAAPHAHPGGGTMDELNKKLLSAISETTILIHSPPDIPKDAEIMGVCALSDNVAGADQYAWIGVDFLRWKALFYGVGNAAFQHWSSSLDITKFSAATVDFEKNFPGAQEAIFSPKCGITDMPADNDKFIEAFLTQLAARARAADERRTTLFLMVFGPVTPERDIVVDFDHGAQKKFAYLTIDKIRAAIRDAVNHDNLPVILMTESPLTGGWMCNPSLFGAATTPHPDGNILQVVARACGGMFADTFMRSFTKRSTPILNDDQRSRILYDDMTPVGATTEQTKLLHKFQRDVHELLAYRLSPLGRRHMLFHDQETDAWSTFDTRKGYPLVGFWDERVAAPMEIDGPNRFEFLGEAFGGKRESQIFHLKYLISVELDTCPGDWTRNLTGTTAQMLADFCRNLKPDTDAYKRAYDAVEFRGSAMILAEILVKALGLPIPGEKCRYWVDKVGEDPFYAKLQAGFADVHNLLDKPAVFPGENRHTYKHVRFFRPARWISAALALKLVDRTDNEIRAFIAHEIAHLIAVIRQTQQNILLQDQSLMIAGKQWIQSLNLGIDLGPDVLGNDSAPIAGAEASQHLPAPVGPAEETKPVATGGGLKVVRSFYPASRLKETPAGTPAQAIDEHQKVEPEVQKADEPAGTLAVDGEDFWSKVMERSRAKTPPPVTTVPRLSHWKSLQETPDMQEADAQRQLQQAAQNAGGTTSEGSTTPTENIGKGISTEVDAAFGRSEVPSAVVHNGSDSAVITSDSGSAVKFTPADGEKSAPSRATSTETVSGTNSSEVDVIQPLVGFLAGMNPEQKSLMANKLMELAKALKTNDTPKSETASIKTEDSSSDVADEKINVPALAVAMSHVGISDEAPNNNNDNGDGKVETNGADVDRLTPPQTPVSVRPLETPSATDGGSDGAEASAGMVEPESPNNGQKPTATREGSLVAGEDFWSQVKW